VKNQDIPKPNLATERKKKYGLATDESMSFCLLKQSSTVQTNPKLTETHKDSGSSSNHPENSGAANYS